MATKKQDTRYLTRRGAVWYIKAPMPDGRRLVQSTGTGDLAEARAVRDQMLQPLALSNEKARMAAVQAAIATVDERLVEIEDGTPAMTMLQAWEAFKTSPKGKTPRGRKINPGPHTLSNYEGRWNDFTAWLDKKHPTPKDSLGLPTPRELRSVTQEQAQKYIAEVKASRSGNTANKALTFLRLAFNVLREAARIKANPFDGMESESLSVERKRPLTVDELSTISKMLAGTGEMELLFSLGYYTGGRLGDIMRLPWGSIDLAARKIHFTPHKTAKTKAGRDGVTHGIPPPLFALLDATTKAERRGLVLKELGEAYAADTSQVCRRIQKVFTDAGIETQASIEGYGQRVTRVGFHSLRHSYITALLERGLPADSVRRLAGHADIGMTMHYFHSSGDALRAVSAALPAMGGATPLPRPKDATTGTLAGVMAVLDGLTDADLETLAGNVAKTLADRKAARL